VKDSATRIHEAFARRHKLNENDFAWLVKFLKDHEGTIELQEFTVSDADPSVYVLLSVQRGYLGDVANVFGDHFPVPFRVDVLNRADPNPGGITVTISWGGGI
jgi:hypothetical protein